MVLIRLLRGNADDDQGQHIVQRVHAGIDRAPKDGQGPGRESHGQLGPDDRQVGDEEPDEDAPYEG